MFRSLNDIQPNDKYIFVSFFHFSLVSTAICVVFVSCGKFIARIFRHVINLRFLYNISH